MTSTENFIQKIKERAPIRAMDVKIINLLSEGKTAKETAEILKMKYKAVSSRVEDIRVLWDVRNTTQLVSVAIREKII